MDKLLERWENESLSHNQLHEEALKIGFKIVSIEKYFNVWLVKARDIQSGLIYRYTNK
jgi:hypothetical protein